MPPKKKIAYQLYGQDYPELQLQGQPAPPPPKPDSGQAPMSPATYSRQISILDKFYNQVRGKPQSQLLINDATNYQIIQKELGFKGAKDSIKGQMNVLKQALKNYGGVSAEPWVESLENAQAGVFNLNTMRKIRTEPIRDVYVKTGTSSTGLKQAYKKSKNFEYSDFKGMGFRYNHVQDIVKKVKTGLASQFRKGSISCRIVVRVDYIDKNGNPDHRTRGSDFNLWDLKDLIEADKGTVDPNGQVYQTDGLREVLMNSYLLQNTSNTHITKIEIWFEKL